jgi:hypothetical protein
VQRRAVREPAVRTCRSVSDNHRDSSSTRLPRDCERRFCGIELGGVDPESGRRLESVHLDERGSGGDSVREGAPGRVKRRLCVAGQCDDLGVGRGGNSRW